MTKTNIFNISLLPSSAIYRGYLISLHIFAYICATVVLPFSLHVIVLFCLIMSFIFYLEKDQKIISLEYAKKTEWIVYGCNQHAVRMQLLPSSVMMRYFLILHFSEPKLSATGKNNLISTFPLTDVSGSERDTKTLILFSDMFSRENYRGLRRCVRMGFL